MNPLQSGRSRSTALVLSVLLLAGGVLVAVGALAGTAHADDRSVVGSVPAAVWIVLLPAVATVLAAWRRPLLGLGLCAGAGVAAVGRLLADLGVLTDPNSAVRPELFYELTTRAQPFTAAAGAGAMVAGDVVLVVAGVLAARSLADRLAVGATPIFDRPAGSSDTGSEQGPELLARSWEADIVVPPGDGGGPADVFPATGAHAVAAPTDQSGPAARSNGVIGAGFVGVLLLLTGSLGLPYSGGYLAARYLPAELGLVGIGSALAVALAGTVAVLVAAALPRSLAAALLGGMALTGAVPLLTAVAVRLAGAPVQLTTSVWVGLAGTVVLAGAARLGAAAPSIDDYDVPSASVLRRTGWIGAGASLLTALAGFAAWRMPQLRYNGGADPVLPGGYAISAPLASPFLLAAIVPAAGAVLWLVPALAPAGRAVATIGWLPLLVAATQTLYLLGQLVSSASVPNAGFAAPRWTAGPGLWWAVGGIVVGIGAAVVALVAGRQSRDASTLLAQEESLARSRRTGGRVAALLALLTVIALGLPAYRTGAGSSATLLIGFDVRSWGILLLGAGMVVAAVAGARSVRPAAVIGFLLAGAAISVVRLEIPASVRAADGFAVRPGWYAGWVVVALFVVAAGLLAVGARRVVMVDAGGADLAVRDPRRAVVVAGRPARTSRSSGGAVGRQGAAAGGRPVGKSTSARASSGRAASSRGSSSRESSSRRKGT